MDKEFGDADELCDWCVENGYQVTNFNELIPKSGWVIKKNTNEKAGTWEWDKFAKKYKVKVS